MWFDCLTGYVLDSQRWKGFSKDTQVGSGGARILDIKVVFWDWAVPDIIPAGQLTYSACVLMLVLETWGAVIKRCISDMQLWEMRWERVNRWFAVPSRTLLTFVQENKFQFGSEFATVTLIQLPAIRGLDEHKALGGIRCGTGGWFSMSAAGSRAANWNRRGKESRFGRSGLNGWIVWQRPLLFSFGFGSMLMTRLSCSQLNLSSPKMLNVFFFFFLSVCSSRFHKGLGEWEAMAI